MNLQEIRAFIALAEELHFTRAAERLEVSQPQFSHLIRRLEQRVEAPLVERTTRRVALTTAGRAVLPHARRALQEMKLIQRSAHGMKGAIQGTVRMGYAGASSRPWLPPIARAVREQLPGVDLQLKSMIYGGQGPGRIVSGDLDISFSRRPLQHPGLLDRVFEYEELLVAVPSDHRLAGSSEVELAAFRDDPWVLFPGAYGSNVRDLGIKLAAEAGFVPKIVQEAPDSYTILGLVAAWCGSHAHSLFGPACSNPGPGVFTIGRATAIYASNRCLVSKGQCGNSGRYRSDQPDCPAPPRPRV